MCAFHGMHVKVRGPLEESVLSFHCESLRTGLKSLGFYPQADSPAPRWGFVDRMGHAMVNLI